MHDFEYAKDKVLMGAERKLDDHHRREKKVTAIHEAGHALLAVLLPHADPMHKVTIIPRGMALGLTQQLPVDEKHNYSRDYLNDRSRSCWAAASPRDHDDQATSPPAPATTSSAPPSWRARWSASGA